MKKSTLIRSDKPHAVNMPAGSNVAQRKGPPKVSDPDQSTEAPPNIQKAATTKAPKVQRVTAPTPAAKTVRTKATLSRPADVPAKTTKPKAPLKGTPTKAVKSTPKARSTAPKTSAKAAAPAEPVWEQDNPVKARIEQLRTRNAQLAEQLQRLQKTPTARGKRP